MALQSRLGSLLAQESNSDFSACSQCKTYDAQRG